MAAMASRSVVGGAGPPPGPPALPLILLVTVLATLRGHWSQIELGRLWLLLRNGDLDWSLVNESA